MSRELSQQKPSTQETFYDLDGAVRAHVTAGMGEEAVRTARLQLDPETAQDIARMRTEGVNMLDQEIRNLKAEAGAKLPETMLSLIAGELTIPVNLSPDTKFGIARNERGGIMALTYDIGSKTYTVPRRGGIDAFRSGKFEGYADVLHQFMDEAEDVMVEDRSLVEKLLAAQEIKLHKLESSM